MLENIKSLLGRIRLPDLLKTRIDNSTNVYKRGRDEYLYKEGNHSLMIYAELLTGNPDIDIDISSIRKWLPPHQDEYLSQEDKNRILKKFCAYLDLNGVSYRVTW